MNKISVSFLKSTFGRLHRLLNWIVIFSFILSSTVPVGIVSAKPTTTPENNFARLQEIEIFQPKPDSVPKNDIGSAKKNSPIEDINKLASTPHYYYAASVHEYGEVGDLGDYHAVWFNPTNDSTAKRSATLLNYEKV